jgi:hypothetical protein
VSPGQSCTALPMEERPHPFLGVAARLSCHPIAQGRAPPPIVLHRWSGESSCIDISLGLFLYRDVSFCLLTGVGPWFPHRFPPRQCSSSWRTSSLLEKGNLIVERAPSSHGKRVRRASLACSGRLAWAMTLDTPMGVSSGMTTSAR